MILPQEIAFKPANASACFYHKGSLIQWATSLYIGGVWIRQPKELNMKRLLGLLPGMGMVGWGGGEAPQQTDGSNAAAGGAAI
jgi:hypothetical protein